MAWELNIKSSSGAPCCHHCSEGALEQAVASAARGANLLGAKPLHHMAGVASVSTGQAKIRGASHCHVADSTLEGEALADGTLGAAHLAAAVAAVHAKLWGGGKETERKEISAGRIVDKAALCAAPHLTAKPPEPTAQED